MAEDFVRQHQFEYRANSNLVLQPDRTEVKRGMDEPSGEAQTIGPKLARMRMGDRLTGFQDPELKERLKKSMENKKKKGGQQQQVMVSGGGGHNMLSGMGSTFSFSEGGGQTLSMTGGATDLDAKHYDPKTRETQEAFNQVLTFIQRKIGDHPHDVLRGAAEEILLILKLEGMRDDEKQREMKEIFRTISNEEFHHLVTLGRQINDFSLDGEGGEEMLEEKEEEGGMGEMGVAVVFDEEDEEEEEDDIDVIRDEESEEDEEEGLVDSENRHRLVGEDDEGDKGREDKDILSVLDIDAHWLQRGLSKYYDDANVSAKMADDVLDVLRVIDERECENKLVLLLDIDKFDFIKIVLKNRAKILYCTLLKQAQSDEDKATIQGEMLQDPTGEGPAILEQLLQKASAESWAQDRLGEFAQKAREEARELNKQDMAKKIDLDIQDEVIHAERPGEEGVQVDQSIDLKTLSFDDGSHTMTNKSCELPTTAWRAQKKGYEEVHVPATRPKDVKHEKLVSVSSLPPWTHEAFESGNVKMLNRIQSRMVDAALHGSENILLCAPTSAGKTNVALLTMLNLIGQYRDEDGEVNKNGFKMVYVAPMKALVQECVQTFSRRLACYGLTVNELSGDNSLTRQQIHDTQLIVTTPEKWDIITRKSGDRTYTQLVKLVIIDEIHLLHDTRGPVLESLVARTIRQVEETQEPVRMVGLSATLPNFEDVATFLRVDPEKGLFFFDNTFRPVPLQQQYIGITERKALKKIQLQNEICYEKVIQRAGKHQVLIFVQSRAETVKTARALTEMVLENGTIEQFVPEGSHTSEILRTEAENCKSPDLADLIIHGFGVHHAGMVRSDRNLVEDLFADNQLQVLVSTATLAWGVNLPAHTVILKGTQMYDPEKGVWVELSPLDIMQMMGRAGRFGLDSEGEGIILTAHSELQYYLSLMNQQLPIESQFVSRLADQLNAEIAMGSVQNINDAAEWLGYTYLFVRMMRNPTLYGASEDEMARDPVLKQRRVDMIHAAANVLDKAKLIRYDRKGGVFHITNLGKVASHYYITHDSMTVYNNNLKPEMSDIEILRLFSLSDEFKNVHVRQEERLELEKMINRVPIPVKEAVGEGSAKVNVLLQAYISRLRLDGFALMSDMAYIQQSAVRILRALFEVALKRGWGSLSQRILLFAKMVERKLWLSQSPLRQFGSVPDVVSRKLERHSDVAWNRYYDLTPQDLGEMVRIPKMGKTLHKYVHSVPRLELSAVALPITRSLLKIELTITPDFHYDEKVHGYVQLFWIIVMDVNDQYILHHEPFMVKSTLSQLSHLVSFTVPIHDPMPPQYFVHVVSDKWLHAETVIPLSFRHLLLPSRFHAHTELLDLQPLPIQALQHKSLMSLYPSSMPHFNPIQTQTFPPLFEGDGNVFVGAPPGSGLLVCAEFAIMKAFINNPNSRCVYVALKDEIVEQTHFSWDIKFGQCLGKNVVKLDGDDSHNLRKLAECHVAIASAEAWDKISRRWRRRKAVQAIDLFVCDNLHLLGSENGHMLEAVVSRMRFMSSQLEEQKNHKVRIVGLSASIANGKDVGDWIGVKSSNLFNFGLSVRPVPLEIRIHSFDISNFTSRMLSMAKPTFNAILAHAKAPQKNVIVFVPSRRQSQISAVDLVMFGNGYDLLHNSNPSTDSSMEDEEADKKHPQNALFPSTVDIENVNDESLSHVMSQGVAYLHHGLSKSDRVMVLHAFAMGDVRVLVTPFSMAWEIDVPSDLVVMMGTESYDGRERRYSDLPATDLIQMMGLASRESNQNTNLMEEDEEKIGDDGDEGEDDSSQGGGKCVVLCHTPKREFLKRILHDPLPVESHFDHFLHDHLNAEIVTNTVQSKPDAVDFLTWSFLFRRLAQNPNYYRLSGTTPNHISDYLSELVETVVGDLEESHCLLVENELAVSPLNLGMISAYYHVQYTTVELFASSITSKTKKKGLLDILSSASEYSLLPMRHREDRMLSKIAAHLPQKLPGQGDITDPATKVHILLQMHFSRLFIPSPDLRKDLHSVLASLPLFIQALVDVIASSGFLKPALAAMEFSQMVVQGMWSKDSPLLQLPHFTQEMAGTCSNNSISTILDLIDMDDDERSSLLPLTPDKMSDVAVFCNSYPSVDVTYEIGTEEDDRIVGEAIRMNVLLSRDTDDESDDEEEGDDDAEDEDQLGVVVSLRYPEDVSKSEQWWIVIGDQSNNSILAVKRVPLKKQIQVPIDFIAPDDAGDFSFMLYVMCDSYMGCDQEYEFNISVLPDDEDEN